MIVKGTSYQVYQIRKSPLFGTSTFSIVSCRLQTCQEPADDSLRPFSRHIIQHRDRTNESGEMKFMSVHASTIHRRPLEGKCFMLLFLCLELALFSEWILVQHYIAEAILNCRISCFVHEKTLQTFRQSIQSQPAYHRSKA
jgi:hypothetical protein